MNAEHLIQKARSLNINVFIADGQLRVHGPRPLPQQILGELRAHKAEIMAVLGDCQTSYAEVMENVQEAIEERAAIMEHDGGIPREQAETQAKANMRVYEYRLTDGPKWLKVLMPGYDIAKAERSLRERFGEKFVSAREWTP